MGVVCRPHRRTGSAWDIMSAAAGEPPRAHHDHRRPMWRAGPGRVLHNHGGTRLAWAAATHFLFVRDVLQPRISDMPRAWTERYHGGRVVVHCCLTGMPVKQRGLTAMPVTQRCFTGMPVTARGLTGMPVSGRRHHTHINSRPLSHDDDAPAG